MAEDVKVTDLKFRPNKVAKAIVLIVLSGLFFGYIGYVYGMGASTKSEDLAVATATPTIDVSSTAIASTTTTDETADWKAYVNDEFNFGISFTDKWEGYKIVENKSGIYSTKALFSIFAPTSNQAYSSEMAGYAKPFVIRLYEKSVYNQLVANADPNEPFDLTYGSKLAENDDYIATYSVWQDSPEDLLTSGLASEVYSVIKSFVFTK